MMMMYKISHDKVEDLAENIEKGLRYVGKAMQCIDELQRENGFGERNGSGYPMHGSTNYRYPMSPMGMPDGVNYRVPEYPMMPPTYDPMYAERSGVDYRRGRDSMGRFVHM